MCLFGVIKLKFNIKPLFIAKYRQNLWEHPKNLGPLLISAITEASNFKFGTQIVFGSNVL